MFNKLKIADIEFNENEKELFSKYMALFLEYNKNVNLISKNDESVLFEKHIFDSLSINLFLKKYQIKQPVKILDIGTGGGFPSLPIALNYKNTEVYAVDSIKKKIKFLESAKNCLSIKNIHPLCLRAEELPIEYRNKFDIVTSRATANLSIISEYALPYVKTGGYFVAYKSLKAEEEIKNAKNALKILNGEIIDKIEYSLPIEEENKRVLIIIKKTKDVNPIYPRKNGVIRKKPL